MTRLRCIPFQCNRWICKYLFQYPYVALHHPEARMDSRDRQVNLPALASMYNVKQWYLTKEILFTCSAPPHRSFRSAACICSWRITLQHPNPLPFLFDSNRLAYVLPEFNRPQALPGVVVFGTLVGNVALHPPGQGCSGGACFGLSLSCVARRILFQWLCDLN